MSTATQSGRWPSLHSASKCHRSGTLLLQPQHHAECWNNCYLRWKQAHLSFPTWKTAANIVSLLTHLYHYRTTHGSYGIVHVSHSTSSSCLCPPGRGYWIKLLTIGAMQLVCPPKFELEIWETGQPQFQQISDFIKDSLQLISTLTHLQEFTSTYHQGFLIAVALNMWTITKLLADDILSNELDTIYWLKGKGLLKSSMDCPRCSSQYRLVARKGPHSWRCPRKGCQAVTSIHEGNFCTTNIYCWHWLMCTYY